LSSLLQFLMVFLWPELMQAGVARIGGHKVEYCIHCLRNHRSAHGA